MSTQRFIRDTLDPRRRDYYMGYKKMAEIMLGKMLVEDLEKNSQLVNWRNIVYHNRGTKSMNQIKREYWRIVHKIERKRLRTREKRRRKREQKNKEKKCAQIEKMPDFKNALDKLATLSL